MKNLNEFIHGFRVHVPQLLNETFVGACRKKDLVALSIPLNLFINYLRTLTFRCSQLNDPVLNKLMLDMTLYEQTNPSSKEYDKELCDKINTDFKEYLDRKKAEQTNVEDVSSIIISKFMQSEVNGFNAKSWDSLMPVYKKIIGIMDSDKIISNSELRKELSETHLSLEMAVRDSDIGLAVKKTIEFINTFNKIEESELSK